MPSANGNLTPLLLDTHYWIWLQAGNTDRLKPPDLDLINKAAAHSHLCLSVMSVWEVAMLESKGRVRFYTSCEQWVQQALAIPGLTLAPITPAIAIESTRLPGTFHGDPADRIIVSTARALNARLLTSDKNIRSYARHRHVTLA
jgi:PIN domain nuclease of toxin-antitoxin system